MITLLWSIAVLAAFVVFMILPTIYIRNRYKPRIRKFYYLQYIMGGHVYYWNNTEESWSSFNDQGTLFSTRTQARQAIGFAENCQPDGHELFDVEIKHCSLLV